MKPSSSSTPANSSRSFGVFLGDFISQVGQKVLELSQHHGAIFILVIQFAELNVVMVITRVLWFLDSFLNKFDYLVELGVFLFVVVHLSKLDADLLGDVETKGIEDVHEVVHVQFTFAIPIIDVADLFNRISINRHFDFFMIRSSPSKETNSFRLG